MWCSSSKKLEVFSIHKPTFFCFYGHFFDFFYFSSLIEMSHNCNGNCSIHLRYWNFLSFLILCFNHVIHIDFENSSYCFIHIPACTFIYLFIIYFNRWFFTKGYKSKKFQSHKLFIDKITYYILPKKGSQGAKQWKKVHISRYMYI